MTTSGNATNVLFDNITYTTECASVSELNGSTCSYVADTSEFTIPLYIYILASLFNTVIFCVGIAGNILVIVVILKVKHLQTSMNLFLLNLSIADILVLVVCQPAGLLEFFGKDRWFLGYVMCKLVPLLENCVLHVSIMTIMAVTMERYHALCRPLKCYIRVPTSARTTMKIVLGIWIIGICLTIPFIVMTEQEDAMFYDGTPVKVCRTKIFNNWRYGYMIFIFVFFFVLPFVMILFLYTLIIKQLTSERLQSLAAEDISAIATLRSRRQVVKMLIVIIVLFFTTLFPFRVVSLWLIFTRPENITALGLEGFLNLILWARTLMYINSAGNPIIYNLTSSKFKMAFKRVLGRSCSMTTTRRIGQRSTDKQKLAAPELLLKVEHNRRSTSGMDPIRVERHYLSIHLILVPQATPSESDV